MSLIDSEAAFQKRCDELLDGLHDMFTHLQITTFSSLAFTVGTPQQAVSEHDMQRFADRVVQGPASIAEVSIVRRIHFEAQTLVMSDIRKQAVAGDTSEHRNPCPTLRRGVGLRRNRLGSLAFHTCTNKEHHMASLTCAFTLLSRAHFCMWRLPSAVPGIQKSNQMQRLDRNSC